MSVHLPPIEKKKKKKSRSKSKSKSRKHKDETTVNTTTILKTLNEFNVSRVEKDNDTTTLENKPKLGVHAFVVDKNIHDNYSAYRLNNNMGIGGGHGPSKKRMGFNGQFVDMDEYNYMKYNGMFNPDLNQSNQIDGSYIDGFQGNQPSQQQYSYPAYNPSTNYNQFYYENAQNPSVSQSVPYFSQPMYQPQYNVHNRYNSYNPSPNFYGNNYQPYQNRVPMLNFNSPTYQGNMGQFPDISTGRIPRTQQLPSISQSNPRLTRYASANRANFGFNQPPVNESWDNSRQRSLGRNYQMKNPSMF